MDIDEENLLSTPAADPSASSSVSDNQTVDSVGNGSTPLLQPPSVAPIPVVPSIAPVPIVSPSIPRPLAPIPVPVRPAPPVIAATAQNGDAEASGSDSDKDEGKSGRGAAMEYEISEESKLARERHEKARQEFLMKRRAAALAVPTNDMAVRARLRRLGEPITLFGEREMERRDRLRMLMARLDAEGQLERLMKAHEDEEAAASAASAEGVEEDIQYPFYTEGTRALLEARMDIAKYSIVRAALRLHRTKRRRDDPDEDVDAEMEWALKQIGSMALGVIETGDERPLSGCSISPDGQMLATWFALSLCRCLLIYSTSLLVCAC